jgi:hypothetical protein
VLKWYQEDRTHPDHALRQVHGMEATVAKLSLDDDPLICGVDASGGGDA